MCADEEKPAKWLGRRGEWGDRVGIRIVYSIIVGRLVMAGVRISLWRGFAREKLLQEIKYVRGLRKNGATGTK